MLEMNVERITDKNMKKKIQKKEVILCLVLAGILVIGGFFISVSLAEKKDSAAPKEVAEEPEVVLYKSPLTGIEREKKYPARPLVVSIDNVGDAVPQSWLSKADLVYEFPVEGQQSRLNAIYYSQFPEEFGPIRSTRPYFVDLTREYKGIFLAHGWSPEAMNYLMSGVVPYINAMNSSLHFYRVDDKTSPHDSYIKWSEVKRGIKEEGWWDTKKKIRSFKFLKEGQTSKGVDAIGITVNYGASQCEYVYDAEKNVYLRCVNGEPFIDKETGKQIAVSNVLVQCVNSYVYDYKGRLSIDMCEGGEARIFTGGKTYKGTWSREDLDSRTIFVNKDGKEFRLTPGKSWVQVADQNTSVTYEKPEAEESAE